MIKYKTENQGKNFIKIDKWFPSTKTCSNCGNVNKQLTLNDRIYNCKECNISIDRDINAGINILFEGIITFLNKLNELEKKELNPGSNSLRDLKDYLISSVLETKLDNDNSISKVVDTSLQYNY